jgi:hypothetical protein
VCYDLAGPLTEIKSEGTCVMSPAARARASPHSPCDAANSTVFINRSRAVSETAFRFPPVELADRFLAVADHLHCRLHLI